MPPIIAATFCPGLSCGFSDSAISPTHSIPRTRGNFTDGESPRRVNHSDRLRPNALTLIKTHPGLAVGVWISVRASFSGPPGSLMTYAFIKVTRIGGLLIQFE